jgi:hypothetical protein
MVGEFVVCFFAVRTLRRIDDASRTTDQDQSSNFDWVLDCGMKADSSPHAVSQIDRRTARIN